MLGTENVKTDEPMSRHTTFRIGGNADYFLIPHSAEEIKEVLAFCRKESLPYFILGNGSNLLVSDRGYRGVVLQLYKNWDHRIRGRNPGTGRCSFVSSLPQSTGSRAGRF